MASKVGAAPCRKMPVSKSPTKLLPYITYIHIVQISTKHIEEALERKVVIEDRCLKYSGSLKFSGKGKAVLFFV